MNKQRLGTILITDTLFIGPEHEERLKAAGFDLERVANPNLSEEELIRALKGKVGYILGGIESVTTRVIEEADCLKAIAFTGSGYPAFIPGHQRAAELGIKISCCPGANSEAVAELALAGFLTLSRHILDLGPGGELSFLTAKSLSDYNIGIVGMGPLGRSIARKLRALGATSIAYENRTRYAEIEQELGLNFLGLPELFKSCDAVFLAAASVRGAGYINDAQLSLLPPNSVIINCSFEAAIELAALEHQIKSGRIRVFQDCKPQNEGLRQLPPNRLLWTNHVGFNTSAALKKTSDLATESIINLLKSSNARSCVV